MLKKFPSAAEVSRAIVDAGGIAPVVHELPYYWYSTYLIGSFADVAQSTAL